MIGAVAVGINQFEFLPEARLYGCVNDSYDFSNFFLRKGATKIISLQDNRATKDKIISAVKMTLLTADKFYFSFSSHGTQVPDVSGDEGDSYDEAFVCYNTTQQFDNLILDDELFNLFAKAPRSTTIEVFLDTCHSGTGLRKLNDTNRIKFIHNPKVSPCACPKISKKELLVKEHPNVILWAACKDTEYASDTEFNGRPNGAFSYYMLDVANKYSKSWRRTIYRNLVPKLEEYSQTPQLESRCAFKYKKI